MIEPRFKVAPVRDPKRLSRIRRLPCLLCGKAPPSEAAHLRIGHVGGTGMKPPDDLTIPLCRQHHDEETRSGPPLFWRLRLYNDPHLAAIALHALARSL